MESGSIICLVEKEIVSALHFPKDDVILGIQGRKERDAKLRQALSLGNIEHIKVKITFQDIEGTKQVETTIWGITDKSIILKKGSIIPIHRVTEVTII
ncbi:MAG: hypothetical protein ACI9J3_002106 [Parvicellaceae bacterium]|jgi:hypothetical protein